MTPITAKTPDKKTLLLGRGEKFPFSFAVDEMLSCFNNTFPHHVHPELPSHSTGETGYSLSLDSVS
jgi:hypothetical protein